MKQPKHECTCGNNGDEDCHCFEIDQQMVSKYLNVLRHSGITNMYGAGPYIQETFGVTKYDAQRFLIHWMKNFTETDPNSAQLPV